MRSEIADRRDAVLDRCEDALAAADARRLRKLQRIKRLRQTLLLWRRGFVDMTSASIAIGLSHAGTQAWAARTGALRNARSGSYVGVAVTHLIAELRRRRGGHAGGVLDQIQTTLVAELESKLDDL